jgi:hypothetical protein
MLEDCFCCQEGNGTDGVIVVLRTEVVLLWNVGTKKEQERDASPDRVVHRPHHRTGTTKGDDKGISPALVWRAWPSGEKATAVTREEWPSSVLRQTSQSASVTNSISAFSGT